MAEHLAVRLDDPPHLAEQLLANAEDVLEPLRRVRDARARLVAQPNGLLLRLREQARGLQPAALLCFDPPRALLLERGGELAAHALELLLQELALAELPVERVGKPRDDRQDVRGPVAEEAPAHPPRRARDHRVLPRRGVLEPVALYKGFHRPPSYPLVTISEEGFGSFA